MRHHPPSKTQHPSNHPVWFHLSAADALEALDASPDTGLFEEEVLRRRQLYGPNELKEPFRRGPLRLALEQFTDFLIVILIAATMISGVVSDLRIRSSSC
jgi:P-type Ca2+ transporter type 2C